MVEANWSRKTEILKALTEPESNMREIASRFNVSRGTIYNTLNEFTNIFRLTEEESDFPRKLLKYYTVELPEGVEPINQSDIRALRHFVERAKKKEMDESDMDAIPGDFTNSNDNNYHAQSIGMSSGTPGGERFDTTTEEGLLRSILYKAKNVNPGAIERFIEAYDLGKRHFTANPQALQQLMMHTFGPGFGSDAFQLFMNTRGQYVADTGNGVAASYGGGNNIMQMLMMQAMMQGGGQNMAQMLPLMMQMGQNGGGGGGQMGDVMGMMMMSQMNKQAEKQAQQEKFDQMMNMMMLRMIGGTMDSRSQVDASSGQFMVQEVLDKDKNVKERHLLPMATVMSNPMMMGGLFRPQQDETTQLVLKNALDEKSKAWEMIATANQPLNQILMTLLGNFQSKNDPVAQFAQLMDIRDKYMGGGSQIDPEIEKMKIDLQLATNQQNMQLEQMKHQWDMEREEKKAGSENVKSWMSMIGQVGEKLATPAMALIAGGMGGGNKAGLLNAGAPGPAGLPPLGAGPQPVKPGDISRPQQPFPSSGSEQSMFGIPDPDHNQHLLPPDPIPQQQEQGGMDPTMMLLMAKQQESDKALQQAMQEIHRLRSVIVQEQHTKQHQQVPLDKKQLSNMSETKLKEILESLKDNESNTEQMRIALEAELSDREWLSSNAAADVEYPPEPRQVEQEPEPVDPNIIEATQQETVEELPGDEPPTQQEIDDAMEVQSEPVAEPEPEPEKKTRRKKQ